MDEIEENIIYRKDKEDNNLNQIKYITMDLLLLKIINKENDFESETVKKQLTDQFKCIITLDTFSEKAQILFKKYIATGKNDKHIKGKVKFRL